MDWKIWVALIVLVLFILWVLLAPEGQMFGDCVKAIVPPAKGE